MRQNILFKAAIVLFIVIGWSCTVRDINRRISFDDDWLFTLGDDSVYSNPGYDDTAWRLLDLPHDWSIEGSFSEDNPSTPGGGALPGGIGWYRRSFIINEEAGRKQTYIEFDGVYRNSEVWINGHYLGKRPYGYSSFRYNITPYLNYGDINNTISVRVDNSEQPNSRWYSGSGIYRHVWLVTTDDIAVDHWGTFVTTPEITPGKAVVKVNTTIRKSRSGPASIKVVTSLLDERDRCQARSIIRDVDLSDTVTSIAQELTVVNPLLWSDTNPYLYNIVTEIFEDGNIKDRYETTVGLRWFVFDSGKGFLLNGEPVKIKGVCNHHDLGALGAAVNTRAIERQLGILKEMGCNGLRTSHNPPAPELLDLCDRMGFIVMDEAFDMWHKGKTEYDYSLDFDQWHRRDLQDMILRDRNHPSVFIWSIGNEILEQWDSTGFSYARELAGIVRETDSTRPVTCACNDPVPTNFIIRSGALDLIGYNYHHTDFSSFPVTFPGASFIASETTSALATRGCYDMPSDSMRKWPYRWDALFTEGNDDYSCSSYDNCSAPWGSSHEDTWRVIKANDFMSGMYIWTGFDYLGEPTPYSWPARSSYFGLIDLAGFPKDAYYMYQSEWTDKPVLHLFPHWNWKAGEVIDVWAYTNCDEVELFLNGRSLGSHSRAMADFHLMWRVPFESGTICAVGKRKGIEVLRHEVNSAGNPAGIRLIPDRQTINAGGDDLSFVKVEIIDDKGNIVPYSDNLVTFSVEGDGAIAALDNGSQVSMEPFRGDSRKAFNGLCLVILKAGDESGMIKLKASSPGLEDAYTIIKIRK